MEKIQRLIENKVFTNKFGSLYNDEVLAPTGETGKYLRWVWNGKGVIVVPVFEGKFALKKMFRYPVGIFSIEFPSGGINNSESTEAAAERELLEEFGLTAINFREIGIVHPDTGILSGAISVVHAEIKEVPLQNQILKKEPMEVISPNIKWRTFSEFKIDVENGVITAGTTISAAYLYLAKSKNI